MTHYFGHAAWLGEDTLLTGAASLGHTPAVLIHGRLDISGPLQTAWELHRAWPGSELIVLDNAGHSSPDYADRIIAATDRFALR